MAFATCLAVALFPVNASGEAYPDPLMGVLDDTLSIVNTEELERFVEGVDRDTAEYLPRLDIREIMSNNGAGILDVDSIARGAAGFFVREVRANLRLLGELILVAVAAAVLTTLGAGFGEEGPAMAGWAVCYMVMVIIGVNSFRIASGIGLGAVDQMMSFMYAIIPALTGLVAASGGVGTAAIVSPAIMAATATVGTVVQSTIIPLILLSAALALAGNVTGRGHVSKLAGLLRSWALLVLGLLATVFVAVTGMRGGLASVSDAASAKAVKFLSGSFVPVVGKIFGDAIDLVATSSLVLKGVIGLFGLVTLGVVCLFPVIKMAVIMFMFRIGAALVQPLGDSRISDCLSEMADALSALCVSVATVGLMFFISIALVVGLGGVVVMGR
jgi:stage III sporulation protein AE